ncbi:MAG: S-methyl-5-thioribose-1-phosphate isomerase [Candidatus Aminicenantes bacterium]|nr:S-methyl-5-thioribose-1-phosphate isomerase [Candidatus Aminicenantes bacterium]
MYPVIEWNNDRVYMLDQRLLPEKEEMMIHHDYRDIVRSIKDMAIRGAPAIGVAAAMGIALAVVKGEASDEHEFKKIINVFAQTRPTAVNLFWALDRMERVYHRYRHDSDALRENIVKEALKIDREDVSINKKIGKNGQRLIKSGQTILTYCNAGSLATAGYGTALGVIRSAVENKKQICVIVAETRPYLQGARLTVWELQKDGIPVKLVTDNSVGYLMSKGMIDGVIVGADRIVQNGDTANKIGTYSIAVLADYHQIPFYVAAPVSTFDFTLDTGSEIPIEERGKEEIIHFRNQIIADPETEVINPAFDITPNRFITAIITEEKVIYPDYKEQIRKLKK